MADSIPQARRGSLKPWPYRPRLLPDELLTSYIHRLAAGMGHTPMFLLTLAMGTRQILYRQDLDSFAPPDLLGRMAFGTGLSEATLVTATLQEFEGTLFERFSPTGHNKWLLPTMASKPGHRQHGLQYCPACFDRHRPAYLRRAWRLAFMTVCPDHAIRLHDACPGCDAVLLPLKVPNLCFCWRCTADLRRAPVIPVRARFAAWQADLDASLVRGWGMLGGEPIRSNFLFAIIRQLAALLVNGKRADRLRSVIGDHFGVDLASFRKDGARQPLEQLRIADRHRIFDAVERLMLGWPAWFVYLCEEAGIYRSFAIKDMDELPFAYARIVDGFLDRSNYLPTYAEVEAAASWLRKTKGIASYQDLRVLCGESRAAIYANMDYQRQPSRRSVWHDRPHRPT